MFQFADFPNLRHLRMVQFIGKLGGVSLASRELSTSQPAVTQAVSNIEADIGAPIFERCATGSYPTEVGKRYLERIDRFFDILDRAVTHVLGRTEVGKEYKLESVDRLMTGTQLRALIVACEDGRVGEIAGSLGMTASSLLRSARSLEKVFEKPLFDRTAQGPIPNRTGNYLVREFRRAVREYELARGEVRLASGSGGLEIVVGALPMAGSHELARATRAFMTAYPKVKIRLLPGEYHKLLVDLQNSRIDMIFGILRRPEWAEDLEEELLFTDSYCLVGRPNHPLCGNNALMPADLVDFEWVVPQANTPRRDRIDAIFEQIEKKPVLNLETASLTMSRAFLMCSDTLTLMTYSEVKPDLELGTLVALPAPFLTNILRKGVTTRSDWLPTDAHIAFLDYLRAVTAEASTDGVDRRDRIKLVS